VLLEIALAALHLVKNAGEYRRFVKRAMSGAGTMVLASGAGSLNLVLSVVEGLLIIHRGQY